MLFLTSSAISALRFESILTSLRRVGESLISLNPAISRDAASLPLRFLGEAPGAEGEDRDGEGLRNPRAEGEASEIDGLWIPRAGDGEGEEREGKAWTPGAEECEEMEGGDGEDVEEGRVPRAEDGDKEDMAAVVEAEDAFRIFLSSFCWTSGDRASEAEAGASGTCTANDKDISTLELQLQKLIWLKIHSMSERFRCHILNVLKWTFVACSQLATVSSILQYIIM